MARPQQHWGTAVSKKPIGFAMTRPTFILAAFSPISSTISALRTSRDTGRQFRIRCLTDYCFSWMRSLARHGSGSTLNPLRVEYVQQRSNLRQIERSLGCEVIAGAPRNVIVFRAADATKPFVTRSAELLDLLAPQFEEQLRQYKDEDSFLELVRRTIQDKLTGHRPSIDAISQALHMGPRTLQRRLQDSGSIWQRVLEEARHQMARYYLSNSVLELNEAAYLLGFEDPNSFGRAFRNWEGVPPSDWRETHRSSAPN